MERKFLYSRGGPSSSHEQAVNASFNDNPYSIELDRLEAFEISSDDPFMMSVLDAKKTLLDEAKLVRKILNRDIFFGEHSKTSMKNKLAAKQQQIQLSRNKTNNFDEEDEDAEHDDEYEINEEHEEDGENKKDNSDDGSSSDDDDVEAEEDFDLDNDYMENHFDNGEDYVIDE